MLNTNITGETMIFRDDKGKFPRYQTSIGKKLPDGTYDNAYIELKFKKGVELENKTKINITNGFLTFYQYTPKDSKYKVTVWQLFVLDFDTDSQERPQNPETEFQALNESVPF